MGILREKAGSLGFVLPHARNLNHDNIVSCTGYCVALADHRVGLHARLEGLARLRRVTLKRDLDNYGDWMRGKSTVYNCHLAQDHP